MIYNKTAPMPEDNRWEDDTIYTETRAVIHCRQGNTVAGEDLLYRSGPIPTAFLVENKKNIVLDFGGAELLLHGRIQPFIFSNCENITLKNVSIRYARSPFTEGVVVAADSKRLTLKIADAFPVRVEDGELIPFGEDWENTSLNKAPMFLQFFNGISGRGTGIHLAIFGKKPEIDPALPWANVTVRFSVREEDGLLILTRMGGGDMPRPDVGDRAVIAHEERMLSGVRPDCCKNVTLKNVRIVNGFGMGIFPFHCENVLIDGLRMCRDESSPGFVSNAADGIHAFACSGTFTVHSSVIEGTVDDALNIHSNFYTVKSVSGCTITAFTGLEPLETTPLFLPGDRIRLHKGFTMEDAGDYEILSVCPAGEKLVRMTLDREVGPCRENDAIENISTQCQIRLMNSRFGKANSHLRFQSRGGVLVENCETELPFLLTGDMTYWFESSPCEQFIVNNTRFTDPRATVQVIPEFVATDAAPYYHESVRIENCSFVSVCPVDARQTREIEVFDCVNRSEKTMVIRAQDCGEIKTNCCRIKREK